LTNTICEQILDQDIRSLCPVTFSCNFSPLFSTTFSLLSFGVATYINEIYVTEVDTYQSTRSDDVIIFESDLLSPGDHTLTVVLLPFKHQDSLNKYITADKYTSFSNTLMQNALYSVKREHFLLPLINK